MTQRLKPNYSWSDQWWEWLTANSFDRFACILGKRASGMILLRTEMAFALVTSSDVSFGAKPFQASWLELLICITFPPPYRIDVVRGIVWQARCAKPTVIGGSKTSVTLQGKQITFHERQMMPKICASYFLVRLKIYIFTDGEAYRDDVVVRCTSLLGGRPTMDAKSMSQ